MESILRHEERLDTFLFSACYGQRLIWLYFVLFRITFKKLGVGNYKAYL